MLYPPYIEGTIPAFYGDEIIVPFTHNPAVNLNDIQGYSLKIKRVNTNTVLGTIRAGKDSLTANGEVKFNINNLKTTAVDSGITYTASRSTEIAAACKIVREGSVWSDDHLYSINGMGWGMVNRDGRLILTVLAPVNSIYYGCPVVISETYKAQMPKYTIGSEKGIQAYYDLIDGNKQSIPNTDTGDNSSWYLLDADTIFVDKGGLGCIGQLVDTATRVNLNSNLTINNYYKLQLAYIEKNSTQSVGYYSTVGVTKYTTRPTVSIVRSSKDSAQEELERTITPLMISNNNQFNSIKTLLTGYWINQNQSFAFLPSGQQIEIYDSQSGSLKKSLPHIVAENFIEPNETLLAQMPKYYVTTELGAKYYKQLIHGEIQYYEATDGSIWVLGAEMAVFVYLNKTWMLAVLNEAIDTDEKELYTAQTNYLLQSAYGKYYSIDKEEKMYSSHFIITDVDGKTFYESEEKLHNSQEDDTFNSNYYYTELAPIEQYELLEYTKTLAIDKSYFIQFIVTTVNGIIISSPKYPLKTTYSFDISGTPTVSAENNFENGYIEVTLSDAATGYFNIYRSSSKDNYEDWLLLKKIAVNNSTAALFKDFLIEQGVIYKYSVCQYNQYGMISKRVESNSVLADFEDIFLYDGKRQLKLKFNPKVSSFKTTKIESKQDTLGGVYPFFQRNGYTNYKEIPINALISYLSDDEELFMTNDELSFAIDNYTRTETPGTTSLDGLVFRSTDLTGHNYTAERKFKLNVLDWLNNGKPKLFKSAAEGTYLVRLMNISLAPTDQLGRMLHSVTGTAYEIGAVNYSNFIKFNFIDIAEKDPDIVYIKTIDLSSAKNQIPGSASDSDDSTWIRLPADVVYYPKFDGISKGTEITLVDTDGDLNFVTVPMDDIYEVPMDIGFTKIRTDKNEGRLTVAYVDKIKNINIDSIKKIEQDNVIDRTFTIYNSYQYSESAKNYDIIDEINTLADWSYDIETKILSYTLTTVSNIRRLRFEHTYEAGIQSGYEYTVTITQNGKEITIDLHDIPSYEWYIGDMSGVTSIVVENGLITWCSYDIVKEYIEFNILDFEGMTQKDSNVPLETTDDNITYTCYLGNAKFAESLVKDDECIVEYNVTNGELTVYTKRNPKSEEGEGSNE